MLKLAAVILTVLLLSSCTDSSGAKQTLSRAGYTKIKIHGYAPLACGEDDVYSTSFSAKNPAGNQTSGVVCSGIMKRGTIRH